VCVMAIRYAKLVSKKKEVMVRERGSSEESSTFPRRMWPRKGLKLPSARLAHVNHFPIDV